MMQPAPVQMMQPAPVQMMQPAPVQMMQPMDEISLELPPELQVNPLNTLYPTQSISFASPTPIHATNATNATNATTTTTSFEPTAFEPTSFEPTSFEPTAFQPTSFQPTSFQPTAFQPTAFQPTAFQPTSFQPTSFQPTSFQPTAFQPTSFQPINNDVPYGCLRNGIKPTYRTYHRNMTEQSHSHAHTLKKPLASNLNATVAAAANQTPEENAMIQERQRKLRELQEKAMTTSNVSAPSPMPPTKLKNKIKQTITKKYKLGRTPGSNVVGVFIKNNETRRQVQEEHGALKRESIIAVRKYLHDHGLLKVGSDAPPDVLRNLYETAKLTGEVNNVNKHVILHNFIATADKDAD
jgi:hypothetical protein